MPSLEQGFAQGLGFGKLVLGGIGLAKVVYLHSRHSCGLLSW